MHHVSSPLERIAYAKFAARIVATGNHFWRMRYPGRGDWILDREGLHSWLYRWGVETGRLEDPGAKPVTSRLSYAASLYARDPEAVLDSARNYWSFRLAARLGRDQPAELELEKAGRS